MSFPIYILDDNEILFTKQDKTHPEFWEETVAPHVAKKMNIPLREIINLPYCQRRGRIVGERFYCGEVLDKAMINKISKLVGEEISFVFDEHESTLEHDRVMFMANFRNPDRR